MQHIPPHPHGMRTETARAACLPDVEGQHGALQDRIQDADIQLFLDVSLPLKSRAASGQEGAAADYKGMCYSLGRLF